MGSTTRAAIAGPHCEPLAGGFLTEPVAAISSFAFVLAGIVIAARYLRRPESRDEDGARHVRSRLALLGYPVLVAGIGIGSLVQHGPDPAYADLVHDLPLLGTLAFVAADSLAALTRRRRIWWWWAVPTLGLVPLILAAPRAGDLAQVVVAVVAVALTVLRARAYPSQRRPIGWAVALLAVGGLIGTLSGAGGPLCDPQSLWQGHAAWHVLAATALVVLAPVVGWGRAGRDDRRPARGTGRTSGPRPGGTHTSVAQKLTASSGDLAEPDPELLITKSRRRSALSRPSACYR